MKQHITKEQLQELDRVQLYKLKDILSHGDPIFNIEEKINMGTMVTIIYKHCTHLRIIDESEEDYFIVSFTDDNRRGHKFSDDELVDTLWKAVKEVLK